MKNLWNTFRLFLWFSFLTGIAYPLLIMLIAHLTFDQRANGSIITYNETQIGSRLIAQKFEQLKYFWPRPSANDYNPLQSGGSNLGPISKALKEAVDNRKKKLKEVSETSESIPSELLYASGSGLDPHLSLKAAYYQIPRIIKARGLELEQGEREIKALIESNAEQGKMMLTAPSQVNVLLLNLALDKLAK